MLKKTAKGIINLDNDTLILHGSVKTCTNRLSLYNTEDNSRLGSVWIKDFTFSSSSVSFSFKLLLKISSLHTVPQSDRNSKRSLMDIRLMAQDFGYSLVSIPEHKTNQSNEELHKHLPMDIPLSVATSGSDLFLTVGFDFFTRKSISLLQQGAACDKLFEIQLDVDMTTANMANLVAHWKVGEELKTSEIISTPIDSSNLIKKYFGFTCGHVASDRSFGYNIQDIYLTDLTFHTQ